MTDILLVTVECVRWDHRHHCPVFDDCDTVRGVAPGSFTRPSLAGLHSGQFTAALDAAVQGPTLAETLQQAGYDTAAVTYSPQTAPVFGFGRGFDSYESVDGDGGPLGRGSRWRERLGEYGLVRKLFRRLQSKNATLAQIPHDDAVVDSALAQWQSMDGPRFLWVHLMGSHRPYGWGDNAMPARVGRRAAEASEGQALSRADREWVRECYQDALRRTGERAQRLVKDVDADVTVVTGDHGEELGRDGAPFFHAPYRRRVSDALLDVPVGARGLDVDTGVSLAALPRRVVERVDVSPPTAWAGDEVAVSAAPWNEIATVRVQSGETNLRLEGVTTATSADKRAVEEQLAALGYY
jgi:arylsulfatase A-like enzyme